MLESGWVQQNIPTTAAKHTAEFPSHILSGWTPLASRLLLAMRTAARVLRGKIFKATRLTGHFEVVRKRQGLGRCFVKLRHGTVFGTSSSVMASRERILKTSLLHLLAVTRLRSKLHRNLSPKTNSPRNSTSTTKHKLKNGRFV